MYCFRLLENKILFTSLSVFISREMSDGNDKFRRHFWQCFFLINLAVPYLTNNPLVYIGYLIISIVQLAATVDYGILFTEDFTNNRKKMSAFSAMKWEVCRSKWEVCRSKWQVSCSKCRASRLKWVACRSKRLL